MVCFNFVFSSIVVSKVSYLLLFVEVYFVLIALHSFAECFCTSPIYHKVGLHNAAKLLANNDAQLLLPVICYLPKRKL